MARSLRLVPDARPARRGPGEVQFGLFPDCGLVLSGLTGPESEVLLSLRHTVTDVELHTLARRRGVERARLEQALGLLTEHGLLRPGRDPGGGGPALRVRGRGALAADLRERLAAAGCRVVAAAGPPPDLTVEVARGALPLPGAHDLPDPVPVLPVVARATAVVVGPVLNAPGGPCPSCLELHRRDRDLARPHVLAQVAAADQQAWGAASDLDQGLLAAAAAWTALVSHAFHGQQPTLAGRAWELCLTPQPEVVTRRWARHPVCRCASRPPDTA